MILPPPVVRFEDINVKIPKNYDKILKLIYNDYMKIPDENERKTHNIFKVDFGDY